MEETFVQVGDKKLQVVKVEYFITPGESPGQGVKVCCKIKLETFAGAEIFFVTGTSQLGIGVGRTPESYGGPSHAYSRAIRKALLGKFDETIIRP